MEINYGPVMFISGKHKGKTGYYDDDKAIDAIVYLGEPYKSEYVVVPTTELASLTGYKPKANKTRSSVTKNASGMIIRRAEV